MIEIIIANQTAILGAVLMACFGAYLVWRNGHKSRVAAASEKFRAAILGALNGLYPYPVNWPSDANAIDHKFKAIFHALQIAVAEFKPFVPWWHQRAFEKAWFVYRLGPEGREIDKQCYHQYTPFVSTSITDGKQVTVDNSKTYKDKFKHNVDNLLRYAKET